MGGGLMQLVAYGAQDIYLTGNPQITFFKAIYRRHTNFAIEAIEQTFNGTVDFGRKVTATISRNGDLIHKVYLQVDLPTLASAGTVAWTKHIGLVLINNVEVEIGGQKIDKHYGVFMHIWNELTLSEEQKANYYKMIGNTTDLTTASASVTGRTLYIPLQFWFCQNIGLALPLIALQFHEVKINLEFRPFSECYTVGSAGAVTVASLTNASLFVDYIYLDNDERKQFAQISHEYLIEQLQFPGNEGFASTLVRQKVNFNHPCKEFIVTPQLDSNVAANVNRWTDFTDGSVAYAGLQPLVDLKLQLNGHDRFSTRKAEYFNQVQPFQHHTRGPSVGIYVYSFALRPEEHQPSGTVNMSRIDNAVLQLTLASSAACKVSTYARNYNVLRIMSGMGGLAYSN